MTWCIYNAVNNEYLHCVNEYCTSGYIKMKNEKSNICVVLKTPCPLHVQLVFSFQDLLE